MIIIFFQLEEPTFLTAGNLVNLLQYASIFVMFAAAEIFALLLSEIDLSLGYIAGVGAFVIAELIAAPVSLPWWLGILGGLAVCAFLGFVQGTLITRLNLPSFVVTLAGSLGFLGLMLVLANSDSSAVGGVMEIDTNSPVDKLVQGNMSTALGWVLLAVGIAGFAASQLLARQTEASSRPVRAAVQRHAADDRRHRDWWRRAAADLHRPTAGSQAATSAACLGSSRSC